MWSHGLLGEPSRSKLVQQNNVSCRLLDKLVFLSKVSASVALFRNLMKVEQWLSQPNKNATIKHWNFYSGFMFFVPIWISRHPYFALDGFDQLPFLNDWAVMFDKSREQNRTWGSWVRGTYATTVLSCPVTTNEYIFKDCPGLKRT